MDAPQESTHQSPSPGHIAVAALLALVAGGVAAVISVHIALATGIDFFVLPGAAAGAVLWRVARQSSGPLTAVAVVIGLFAAIVMEFYWLDDAALADYIERAVPTGPEANWLYRIGNAIVAAWFSRR